MDRDILYIHFANLCLVLIGLFTIQAIVNPFILIVVVIGVIAGFVTSWLIKDSRPQHMETFTGMLSLAAVVILLSRLYDMTISFENLLKLFSTILVWLALFQSFDIRPGKNYALLQFISISLLIISVGLALEKETFYIMVMTLFLFLFIFIARLSLVFEKKKKGSIIIGDEALIMGLWHQVKISALMFSIIILLSSLIYPFVPRFNNLSLRWIPSALLGIPEQVQLLKLLNSAQRTIKEDISKKEEQRVDDGTKKRETSAMKKNEDQEQKDREKEHIKEETVERFPAKDFNKDIDSLRIKSLTIKSNTTQTRVNQKCMLEADLEMNDGSIIPATRLVDWKVKGTAKVQINSDGTLTPQEEGYANISASYLGVFSNDIHIEILKPATPLKKKGFLYHLLIWSMWLVIILFLSFVICIFTRAKRLSELAIQNPRKFIKELYLILCRSFRPYGISRTDTIAPREFVELTKEILLNSFASMQSLTEKVLEASFSLHAISREHSYKALELVQDIKNAVLNRDDGKQFWRKILFSLLLLEVSFVEKK